MSTDTKLKYNHTEAFCVMKYASRDGREVEYLWNSRDGVTPYIVIARDGVTELRHVDWNLDCQEPDRIPEVGERIFIDYAGQYALDREIERARSYLCHNSEELKWLARRFSLPAEDVDSVALALAKRSLLGMAEPQPSVITVTPEIQAVFITLKRGGDHG